MPKIVGVPLNHTDWTKPGTHETMTMNQWFKYELFHVKLEHERKVYGILDALGDYGGLEGVILVTAAYLLSPVASHSFFTKAIQKLFIAKTKDANLFP